MCSKHLMTKRSEKHLLTLMVIHNCSKRFGGKYKIIFGRSLRSHMVESFQANEKFVVFETNGSQNAKN